MIFIPNNVYLIVECKKSNDIYIDEARDQLFSYSAACLNAKYGIVASSKCEIWQKVPGYDEHTFEEIEFLPNAAGEKISFDYQPPR